LNSTNEVTSTTGKKPQRGQLGHSVVMSLLAPGLSPEPDKEITLQELIDHFHLPEKAAAKKLNICLTSLKKLCRRNRINRWPFRKVCPLLG